MDMLNRLFTILKTLFYNSITFSILSANIINVPADSSTIQGGINGAVNGDTVLVQPGIYTENIIWPATNSIKLISAGDSSNTIIDGGGVGTVLYMSRPDLSNSIDTTTVIKGFKITNGRNVSNGGGMYLHYSSPLITEMSLIDNMASSCGGGMFLSHSYLILSKTRIFRNSAVKGGGLYSRNDNNAYKHLSLYNVIINNNTATESGGGMYLVHVNISSDKVIIINNSAAQSGGGVYVDSSRYNISNLTIANNSAGIIGGGMVLRSTDYGRYVRNLSIISNSSNYYGGILLRGSRDIINCTIANNNFNSGSAIFYEYGDATISFSNFCNNGAAIAMVQSYGTAVYNFWGHYSGPYTSSNTSGLGDSIGIGYLPWSHIPWLEYPSVNAPPIPPQNTVVTGTGIDFIGLKWDTNPMLDLAGYNLYYDSDTRGYPYANSVNVGADTSFSVSNLSLDTTYYFAVTTYDYDGNESWFSNEVTVVPGILQAKNLNIGGSENQGHIINHTPVITWEYYDIMGEVQTHYQVQISSTADFTLADLWDSGEVASADTSVYYGGSALADGSSYFMRVKVGSNGLWGLWSILSFRMNTEPTTPVVFFPINDDISGSPVVLRVLNSNDDENDELAYSFNLYSDSGLATILDSVTNVTEGNDTTSWQVTAALPDHQWYYWTVDASDGYESSPVSDTASFLLNIANDAPAEFNLLSPVDSAEITSLTLLLEWSVAIDPDPLDTVRYTLYFDTPDPGVHAIPVDINTIYQTPSLMDNTTYYWKIVAADLSGATTESSGGYHSFRVNTTNDLPGDFALLSPENEAMVIDLTPTFNWNVPIDPDDLRSRSITSYDFYLGYDSSFTAVEPISVDTNQFIPFGNLAEDQMYFWKVVAFDNDGGNTISSIWSFWTNSVNSYPIPFSVISPTNGADIDTVSPTFTWHPSTDNDLNDVVVYNIHLGESVEDIEPVYTGIVPWINDTTFTLLEPLNDNTTYYWKVIAQDLSGAPMENIEGFQTFNVNLGNESPSQVTLVAPIEGSIQTNLQPNFYWTESIDPDPQDSITYTLNWWPISPLPVIYGVVLDTNGYAPADSLTDNSLFEWRVEARDEFDSTSMSDTSYFYTDAFPEPPLAFNTVEPQNDQTVLSDTVLFIWNRTIDPDPLDEVWYKLAYTTDWTDSSTYMYIDVGLDTSAILYLDMNTEYFWQVSALDNDGLTTFSDENQVNRLIIGILSIGEEGLIPELFALHQNYPNPFNPITTIQYDLPVASNVQIVIYDLLGRQISTLVNRVEESGYKQIIWNANNTNGQPIGAGVYFYQIRSGEFVQTKKMILLK